MKKTLLLNLAALFVGIASPLIGICTASAETSELGLFVEPGVTYEMGKTKTDWPGFSSSSGESSGFGLMGRLGLHVYDIVFAGVDARYSMPNFKDSSVNYSADATQFNWGPMVGIQTPVFGIRVWGNYIVGGFLDPKQSGNGFDVKLNNPTGYRVGVGGRFLMLSVNLEYQNLKYDSLSVESFGGFSVNGNYTSVKPTNESWIVSVSFPISI